MGIKFILFACNRNNGDYDGEDDLIESYAHVTGVKLTHNACVLVTFDDGDVMTYTPQEYDEFEVVE